MKPNLGPAVLCRMLTNILRYQGMKRNPNHANSLWDSYCILSTVGVWRHFRPGL